MGLIKAGMGAVGGTLADQWKEFFYCESMPKEVLVTKGQKRVTGRSSNTKGNDNIISNGSGIAVADGQCMIIVEQGKVVEVCAEPGEFTYDTSSEPSIFAGNLGESIKETFKTVGKRFTYGGDTGKDQRVYYFNTKEILENRFEELDATLKTEFISALQPAFGHLSELELRPNQIVTHNTDLENAMNTALSEKWGALRGLQVVSIALGSVTLPDEDAELIKQAQRTAIMRDPTMAAATLVGAQADAMKTAAGNQAGAMTGFMGMGMAMNQGGGMNAQNLFAMGQQQQEQQAQQMAAQQAAQQQMAAQQAAHAAPAADGWKCTCGAVVNGNFCPNCGSKKPEPQPAPGAWKCKCGATATGKFCPECGSPKPVEEDGWTCSCGTVNKGKFCQNCGSKKPEGAPLYRCDKCGWEPEDPTHPPKFCPECGDIFDENDRQ